MNNHQYIERLNAYDKRAARLSILVDWLNGEVVFDEDERGYNEMLTRAVDFLFQEVQECLAEQERFADECLMQEIDDIKVEHDQIAEAS